MEEAMRGTKQAQPDSANTTFGLPNDQARWLIQGAMSRPVPLKNSTDCAPNSSL